MWNPRLIVTVALCSVFLLVAMLNAESVSAAAPGNNDLGLATNITSLPLPYSNTLDTMEATRQTGEPMCDLIANTVWYRYTPTGNVTLNVNTTGSDFDTVLAVFKGPDSSPTFGALTLIGCNDDVSPPGIDSQVVFAATAGTTYYFQAGGVAGGSGSLTFNLSVSAVTPPANDNFFSAVTAAPLPYANSRSTAGAALEPAEQRPCGGQLGATVWYTHTPSASGTLTATTAGSGFDTVLAVYTGSSLATLTMLSCDDDGGPGKTSQLTLTPSGTTYYFQVGGFDNATGSLTFNLSFVPDPDSDGDGWSNTSETTIGTDPLDACRDNSTDNAWPPDMDNDTDVDTADIAPLTAAFGKPVPSEAPVRYDIGEPASGFVDTRDIARLTSLFGQHCTP